MNDLIVNTILEMGLCLAVAAGEAELCEWADRIFDEKRNEEWEKVYGSVRPFDNYLDLP